MSTPLVTIRCLVYNHEPYLRQCLDGFVMQKTNFPFEAIVHDDASTDRSAEIIREYAKKYPDIIKPILETENQYSKRDGSIQRIMNEHTRGKYVAMCEGDDYWIDPFKLQKQVEFLETHSGYVMCSHKYQYYFQDQKTFGDIMPQEINSSFTYDLNYYIHRNSWVTQTLTCVFLYSALDYAHYSQYKNVKDLTLIYHILQNGKGYFMNENMGVYRKHRGGVWSSTNILQMKISDLKAIKGIWDIDFSDTAVLMMKSYVEIFVNPKDYILNLGVFMPYLKVIKKKYGLFVVVKLIFKQFNKSFFLRLNALLKK